MIQAISSIHAKAQVVASKAHAAVKSHALIAVYLAVLAVVAIPLISHIWDYWRPVLVSYKLVGEAPKTMKGRL